MIQGKGSGNQNAFKHGMTGTPTYNSWLAMRQRCCDSNTKQFKNYGGRGIVICDRWLKSFNDFYEDMGEKPIGLTLERINNNGNYELLNCKWATYLEQNNNARSNQSASYKGRTLNASQWSRVLGIPSTTIRKKIRNGWSIEKIIKRRTKARDLLLYIDDGVDLNEESQ